MKCWVADDFLPGQRLARAHGGQAAGLLVLGVVVAAFLIELEEAVELDDAAGGAQVEQAGGDLGRDVDGGAFELGGFHLARDRAQPDQLVELGLVGIEPGAHVARAARRVGRADRLVGFLGVLGLGLVAARRLRDIGLAVFGADELADRDDRLVRDLHAVGAHIGDEADGVAADVDALIKALRDPHGVGGRKAELAARLLLQGRGGEGRIGIALRRLGLDIGHREGGRLQRLLERGGVGAGPDVEPLDLLAVGAHQPGLERLRPRRRQRRHQRPVFPGDEFLDFELAVAYQPQRHRLHPPGRARARQLAPQHRRQGEADQIVERAAGEIGIHQRLVDGAGMLHRLGDRLLGDGVEDHPLDRAGP